MGLFNELKKLTRPYDIDGEPGDEMEEMDEPADRFRGAERKRANPFAAFRSQGRPQADEAGYGGGQQSGGSYGYSQARQQEPPRQTKAGRVVNMPGQNPTQFVLATPKDFKNHAGLIADKLMARCPIVLNLEKTPDADSRRLLDFLSGVAFAQDGKVQVIATRTYLIMPYNTDITGDEVEELNSGGAYL